MSKMTLLKEATDSKKFDTRVVERNISRGFVKAEELENEIESLPDDSGNADYVSIETLASDPNV